MLQDGGIDNRTTAREVLRLYARFYRDPEDPDRLLEAVDLGQAAGTRYRRLSGGEKQRLALALALLGRPGAAGPRRADRGHGPGGEAGDPRAHRRPARGGHDDPADDARARRRRAAGRPGRRPRPRTTGRARARRPSSRAAARRACTCACRARSRTARRPTSPRSSGASPAGGRSSRRAVARRPGPTTSRTLDGRRARDSSRRWRPGASPGTSSLVELRTGAASLEERYLELVRGGQGSAGNDEGER